MDVDQRHDEDEARTLCLTLARYHPRHGKDRRVALAMDREAFVVLADRLASAWNAGDAIAAADCFAEDVDYADPRLYHFSSRAKLVPFFEPGPHGHAVTWHRLLFDDVDQVGVLEYTYVGHHRYHGVAIVEFDSTGRFARWREWQHRDDERDWEEYLAQASATFPG